MADTQSPKAPRARSSHKSLAHLPSMQPSENQENATIDGASFSAMATKTKQQAKKSRSKSLGPGGLEALKEGTGNRGRPSLPQLKSILKQTMPLSLTPKNPTKIADATASSVSPNKAGQASPRKSPGKSPGKAGDAPQGSPRKSPGSKNTQTISSSASPSRVALRTEEEQQAAAKERELQEVQARKEARRKSLAARRVSFAPEATLHTWNVVEPPEDSTTSSASTNSTRRASGMTADMSSFDEGHASPPQSDGSEPPSTPPEQRDDVQVAQSPAHQRDMHQKKRRRSSTVPAIDFNEPHELSSSPFSGESEDDTGTQAFETADEGSESSESDEDLIVQDETVQNVDDSTFQSSSSTTSDGRLDAALKQAAHQAGTRGIAYDEHGEDVTMEMADDEITEAFQPWMQQSRGKPIIGDANALLDQENVNPFSPAFKADIEQRASDDEGDMTMDMTQPVGGILDSNPTRKSPAKDKRRKSVAGPGRRRSSVARRRSSEEDPVEEDDQTMDFTTAVGQIQGMQEQTIAESQDDAEDISMDFTSAVGGVITGQQSAAHESDTRRESVNSRLSEEDMDFTQAIGGILSSITERTEPDEQTMEMDMTKAVGSILPQPTNVNDKKEAKALMELEADAGQISTATPFHDGSPQKPVGAGLQDERPIRPMANSASAFHDGSPHKSMGAGLQDERPLPAQSRRSMTSEAGSPGLVAGHVSSIKPSSSRRPGRPSKSPKATPLKKPATPSKQLTPKPARPITPGKTPPASSVAMRSASPKKLFEAEIRSAKKQVNSMTPESKRSDALFQRDPVTGAVTPSVILKPHKRRSSGFGIDREGLGSPRVSALLDRRSSIGDSAKVFAPNGGPAPSVRFEDPRAMDQEIERERAEEIRAESGLGALQDEANAQDLSGEQDSTRTLKGMIESMTPQKKKLNGRKSLHVGAAKGVLGKRPAELDDDDDDDATPKKLKGREGSPVKKIKLPGPKAGTGATSRVTRSNRLSLAETAGNARSGTPITVSSPGKNNTTPRGQLKFKDPEASSPAKVTSFESKVEGREAPTEPAQEEDNRLRLQDFLQVTGIRFMDQLTTTKRRHTLAPHLADQDNELTLRDRDIAGDPEAAYELEACVVAGACTIPMLELYQHSCRELKSYISEGRKVVKEIEQATYEDNPPLFQEYLSAPADVRPIMDNQFRNVKTNARLLSKAMWYEWRMKLLESLKEGLTSTGKNMGEDERGLTQQEQILEPVFPALTQEHEKLTQQVELAQSRADELAQCDQEELKQSRKRLLSLDEDLVAKRRAVEELEDQLREKEDGLEAALNRKQECAAAIEEAEGIRQQCRGWSTGEVAALQSRVCELEAVHGWSISAVSSGSLAMTYRKAIQLHFSPSSFDLGDAAKNGNAAISLTYVADANEYHPRPLTTEKRFFLQIIRAQLQCLQQSQYSPRDLLAFVSNSWDTAIGIFEEAKALDVGWLTESAIRGDETIAVSSLIYLPAMQTKVEATFEVRVTSGQGIDPLNISVEPSVRVGYGETLNEAKMSDFMASRVKGVEGYGVWAQATKDLEDKLIARGRKERK